MAGHMAPCQRQPLLLLAVIELGPLGGGNRCDPGISLRFAAHVKIRKRSWLCWNRYSPANLDEHKWWTRLPMYHGR